MLNEIKYIIPSYKRADILCNTTLKLLDRAGVEAVSLYINRRELNDYKTTIESHNFNIVVIYNTVDFDGIGKLRNYIRNSHSPRS